MQPAAKAKRVEGPRFFGGGKMRYLIEQVASGSPLYPAVLDEIAADYGGASGGTDTASPGPQPSLYCIVDTAARHPLARAVCYSNGMARATLVARALNDLAEK